MAYLAYAAYPVWRRDQRGLFLMSFCRKMANVFLLFESAAVQIFEETTDKQVRVKQGQSCGHTKLQIRLLKLTSSH